MLKVLIKNVNESLEEKMVETDLSSLQELVGGYMETLTLDKSVILICNEDGNLRRLENNFVLYNDTGILDTIVGNVFFTTENGHGDFVDLTQEQIDYVKILLDEECK